MPDRENVIKGLECCSKGDCADCDNCTYHGVQTDVPCESTLMRDALALLKAQEPVVMAGAELTDAELIEKIRKAPIAMKPIVNAAPVVHGYWREETDRNRHWHCSNCGKVQGITCVVMKYCPECGAKMAEHPWAASGRGQAFSPD